MKQTIAEGAPQQMAPETGSAEFEAFDAQVHQAVGHLKELMSHGRYGCNVLVAATTALDEPAKIYQGYLMATGTEQTLEASLANVLKRDRQLCAVVGRAVARAAKYQLNTQGNDGADTGRTPAGGDKALGVLQS